MRESCESLLSSGRLHWQRDPTVAESAVIDSRLNRALETNAAADVAANVVSELTRHRYCRRMLIAVSAARAARSTSYVHT